MYLLRYLLLVLYIIKKINRGSIRYVSKHKNASISQEFPARPRHDPGRDPKFRTDRRPKHTVPVHYATYRAAILALWRTLPVGQA